jgi:hypothetical protein
MIFYRVARTDHYGDQPPDLVAVFGEASDGLSLNGGVSKRYLDTPENFLNANARTRAEIAKASLTLGQAIDAAERGEAKAEDFPDHRGWWLAAAQAYRRQCQPG